MQDLSAILLVYESVTIFKTTPFYFNPAPLIFELIVTENGQRKTNGLEQSPVPKKSIMGICIISAGYTALISRTHACATYLLEPGPSFLL